MEQEKAPSLSQDSLPARSQTYQGFRIHLHDLQVSKQSDDWLKISYVPINTGREDLRFGDLHLKHLQNLVIAFDEDFTASQLAPLQASIEATLLREDLTILAGKVLPRKEMKIPLQQPLSAALGDPTLQAKGDPKPKKKKKKSEADSFSINVGEGEATTYLDKNNCADLIIDTLKIIKQSKRSVTLEYTIVNQGKGPANLLGSKKGNADNVAFKAHLSSSNKLKRGNIVIGGGFVRNPNKGESNLLAPNESWVGTLKLDLHKMTRFTPYIILELDTYQGVRECNERNNRNAVKVELGDQ
ncbi:MAG: hypothetical protein AAGD05_12660 [Bacteroidota bacterium]